MRFNMRKTCLRVILAALTLTLVSTAHSIEIVKTSFRKATVAVPRFTQNGTWSNDADIKLMTSVLRFDLDNSGYLEVLKQTRTINELLRDDLVRNRIFLGAWSAIGAEMLVRVDCAMISSEVRLTCTIYDLKTKRQIYRKKITGKASGKRYIAHTLSNSIIKELTGEKGIATTRIAFSADRGTRGKEIYLIDYDGANLRRITQDKVVSIAPDFDPKGNKLYYTSYLKGYPKIVSINLKSGARNVVSSYTGLNAFADISPNGKEMLLSLSKDGAVEIYLTALNAGDPKRLTRSSGGVGIMGDHPVAVMGDVHQPAKRFRIGSFEGVKACFGAGEFAQAVEDDPPHVISAFRFGMRGEGLPQQFVLVFGQSFEAFPAGYFSGQRQHDAVEKSGGNAEVFGIDVPQVFYTVSEFRKFLFNKFASDDVSGDFRVEFIADVNGFFSFDPRVAGEEAEVFGYIGEFDHFELGKFRGHDLATTTVFDCGMVAGTAARAYKPFPFAAIPDDQFWRYVEIVQGHGSLGGGDYYGG